MNRGARDKPRGRVWCAMRWIGLRVCAAVVLGAATTVGVAWWCFAGVGAYQQFEMDRNPIGEPPPFVADVYMEDDWAVSGPVEEISRSEEHTKSPNRERLLSEAVGSRDHAGWPFLSDPREDLLRLGDRFGRSAYLPRHTVTEQIGGWPFPAMVNRFWIAWVREGNTEGGCTSGIPLPDATRRYPDGTAAFRQRALPIVPVWPGFMQNTAIFAAAWLVALVARPSVRRRRAWRRRVGGFCESCGYSRRGLAEGGACPECGKVLSPASDADSIPLRRRLLR